MVGPEWGRLDPGLMMQCMVHAHAGGWGVHGSPMRDRQSCSNLARSQACTLQLLAGHARHMPSSCQGQQQSMCVCS